MAIFDLVDRGLDRAETPSRDAETVALIDEWLQRPSRDTTRKPAIGGSGLRRSGLPSRFPSRCARPTSIYGRKAPFQLSGGGSGIIETAGVDSTSCTYWMARYYGVIAPISVQSSASPTAAVTPLSIASFTVTNLAAGPQQARHAASAALARRRHSYRDRFVRRRASRALDVCFDVADQFRGSAGTAAGAAQFSISNGSATSLTTTGIRSIRRSGAVQHARRRPGSGRRELPSR